MKKIYILDELHYIERDLLAISDIQNAFSNKKTNKIECNNFYVVDTFLSDITFKEAQRIKKISKHIKKI